MKEYIPRIVDSISKLKLETMGAVYVKGAKWCGKTTTSEQFAKSVVYLDDPESGESLRAMAEHSPSMLLQGIVPRLIDEWQLVPSLWDAIRFTVDKRGEDGQFIITGSVTPPDDDKKHHSGTGRISRLIMRPMTLAESGNSSKQVSLKDLFEGNLDINGESSIRIDELAFLACRGGWPRACKANRSRNSALQIAREYIDAITSSDITTSEGSTINPTLMKHFLRVYARNIGSQIALSDLSRDLTDTIFSEHTALNYHKRLSDTFVIEDMDAWNPNLRSKTAVRTSPTRYFTDPSLAAASLGAGPDDLIADMKTFGFILENLCIRDLRVYAQPLDGDVLHYRDKNNLECDAVVHLRNGRYGLIEIKMGGQSAIEHGAETLKKLAQKIDTERMATPSFLMVLTGVSPIAYQRADGVLVVPVGCLCP